MSIDFDAVIIGAGFGGMYMLHRLRQKGFTARVFEAGKGVGGTWYWNRYPGARCDVESVQYSYQFSPELEQEWEWSERYATQPELLRYANHVADRYDLRRDMRFETRVTKATFDETANLWRVETGQAGASGSAEKVTARFVITAMGCLSSPNTPKIPGLEDFKGPTYHTGNWPHEGRRLHRQDGGRDRHGLLGHPVDPGDGRAGQTPHRVPAHGQLHRAGAQQAARSRLCAGR